MYHFDGCIKMDGYVWNCRPVSPTRALTCKKTRATAMLLPGNQSIRSSAHDCRRASHYSRAAGYSA